MSTNEKPKKLYQHLGMDVKLENTRLIDPPAQAMLKRVGSEIKPAMHTYAGSVAVHIYLNELGAELSTISQVCLGDVNEGVALVALSNLQIEMKKHYGRRNSTTDKNDKR